MKVAAFSDAQANYPGLLTVVEHILAWSPDLVIMNGDLISRGPRSFDCLNLFESLRHQHDWVALRGNHEDFVWQCSKDEKPAGSPIDIQMQLFADWTSEQLGERIDVIGSWQDSYQFSPPGTQGASVAAMHGTLLGNRVGILANTSDEELAERVPKYLSVFLTAHTHRPLIRDYNGCQIVNTGSAGSPFDGDPRASYAQLLFTGGKWKADIVRVEYDREQADRDYHNSGFLEEGGPLAELIYEEWKQARSLMPHWRRLYFESVLNGEISLQSAVRRYLETLS